MKKNRASDSSNGIFVKLGKVFFLQVDVALHLGPELGKQQGWSFSPNLLLWGGSLVNNLYNHIKSPEHIYAWCLETTILIIHSCYLLVSWELASHLTCLSYFFPCENASIIMVLIS